MQFAPLIVLALAAIATAAPNKKDKYQSSSSSCSSGDGCQKEHEIAFGKHKGSTYLKPVIVYEEIHKKGKEEKFFRFKLPQFHFSYTPGSFSFSTCTKDCVKANCKLQFAYGAKKKHFYSRHTSKPKGYEVDPQYGLYETCRKTCHEGCIPKCEAEKCQPDPYQSDYKGPPTYKGDDGRDVILVNHPVVPGEITPVVGVPTVVVPVPDAPDAPAAAVPVPAPAPVPSIATQQEVELVHIVLWLVIALICALVQACYRLSVLDGSNEPEFKPKTYEGAGVRGKTTKM